MNKKQHIDFVRKDLVISKKTNEKFIRISKRSKQTVKKKMEEVLTCYAELYDLI